MSLKLFLLALEPLAPKHQRNAKYGLIIAKEEPEIIQGVAKGLSNRKIAEALFLSEGTVRNYLSTILNKLNLRDHTQLASFYLKEAN